MSSAPTPDDFQDAIDEYWHDRPPASLEDVMALYGVLAVAESGGQLYKTPSELNQFVNDGRIISISIDSTQNPTKIVNVEQDVLRDQDVPKLAYSHKASGQGSKYSLTQIGSGSGNEPQGVVDTRYGPLGKLAGWSTQDSIQELVEKEEHPDTWVIEEIGSVLDKKSESLEQVAETIEEMLPVGESIPTVLTVRFRADTTQLESVDGDSTRWFWPDEIEVLNVAMKRYATANAADKNIDSGPSSTGTGYGVVSGKEGRMVGTPASPLGVFSVKHPDAQPGLRKEDSWRNYPVDPTTALLFTKSQDIVDRCVYRNGGMETYALPYFAGEMTGLKADALSRAIDSVSEETEIGGSQNPPMAQVTFDLLENDDPDIRALAEQELRFYTITMPISDDKNIIAEEPAASLYWPLELSDALRETINGPTLDTTRGGFAPFDNWPLLQLDGDKKLQRWIAYARITNHEFTDAVFAYRDDEGDDFRRIVDHRLLSGTPIAASTLFEEYLNRYADASGGTEPPPHQVVVQQLVHFETLARAGLLRGINYDHTRLDSAMPPEPLADMSNIASIREHRLNAFLDRPLFADDGTRRAAALAGVLVGQISWHQEHQRNVGRPLDAGTKGNQLTKNGLETALTGALEKAKVYAQDSDQSYHRDLLYPETVDRLLEETEMMPTDWNIDKRELQFCYVLGHAHGRRSMPVAYDLKDAEDESENDATTEQTAN